MVTLKFEVNGALRATRTLVSILEIDLCQGLKDGDKITLKVEDHIGVISHTFEATKKVPGASKR